MKKKSFLDKLHQLSSLEKGPDRFTKAETEGVKYLYEFIPGTQWEPALLSMSIPITPPTHVSWRRVVVVKKKKSLKDSKSKKKDSAKQKKTKGKPQKEKKKSKKSKKKDSIKKDKKADKKKNSSKKKNKKSRKTKKK